MRVVGDDARLIADAHEQALQDGYRRPFAIVEMHVGEEPEPDLGPVVEVEVCATRRPAGPRRRRRLVNDFAALCETVLACVPAADDLAARPCAILAALLEGGGNVARRRFHRAMQKLAQDRRVTRTPGRGGAVTYRRTSP